MKKSAMSLREKISRRNSLRLEMQEGHRGLQQNIPKSFVTFPQKILSSGGKRSQTVNWTVNGQGGDGESESKPLFIKLV